MSAELRNLLDDWDNIRADAATGFVDTQASIEAAEALANAVRALLDEPTNVQALALARLMRDRPSVETVSVVRDPFDLPKSYWSVQFEDFACGIAPDGSVSS